MKFITSGLYQTGKITNDVLNQVFDKQPHAPVLQEAMKYAVLNGGKRLRPFLVVETAKLLGLIDPRPYRVAAAVECIHCYSLVHDDLPAMDDDDMRRGQPTVHKKYDEATAVLVGDALQSLAFEILSDTKTHKDAEIRIQLCAYLAKSAGGQGMVAGQMLDMQAEQNPNEFDYNESAHNEYAHNESVSKTLKIKNNATHTDDMGNDDTGDMRTQIEKIQDLKTGKLIQASVAMGAILAGATQSQKMALQKYAQCIGVAFQVADDLLDALGNAVTVGKGVGKDNDRNKATFVSLLGIDGAKSYANDLVAQAKQHLQEFGESGDTLARLSEFIVNRDK